MQDLYTTISKQFFRDFILYYEITEIRTDSGIFVESINTETYLKFDKKVESLVLRHEDNYYSGESVIGIQIRLSDNIFKIENIKKCLMFLLLLGDICKC